MSLRRMNHILLSGIVPFNYGMEYEDWKALWLREPKLVGSDPATWTAEEIAEINREAAAENELVDRLMAMSDEEFSAEVKRLEEANVEREDQGEATERQP